MRNFKSLDQIVKDSTVARGDLLLVQNIFLTRGKGLYGRLTPVFYGGVDTYVSRGRDGFKEGERFEGVRVFHFMHSSGSYGAVNEHHTHFYDYSDGLFLPFHYDGEEYTAAYVYALLLKKEEFLGEGVQK